jgi:hypothetical protein
MYNDKIFDNKVRSRNKLQGAVCLECDVLLILGVV